MRNYELTDETMEWEGRTLHRIRATRDFSVCVGVYDVSKGQVGGWVESEENLDGDAWVSGNARVYGDARVFGNALIMGAAMVFGRAQVSGNAVVGDHAKIFDNARVSDYACVYADAQMCENSSAVGRANVFWKVSGNIQVCSAPEAKIKRR